MVAILAVTGATVGGVLAATGSLGFLQERAQLQSYDTERFDAQRRGIRYGETYPLGIGPGQFEVRAPLPSHNLYIRSLSEQGFLGLLVILGIVVATLIFAARNAVLGRDTYGIGSAALLGAWVGICVESFVIDTLHWRHLFLVAALIWVGARRAPPRTSAKLWLSGNTGRVAPELPNRACIPSSRERGNHILGPSLRPWGESPTTSAERKLFLRQPDS